jgi:putative DNA primase/helicase
VLKQDGASNEDVRKARQRQSRDVVPRKAMGPASVATDGEARDDDRLAGAISIKATQIKAYTQRPDSRAVASSRLDLALRNSFRRSVAAMSDAGRIACALGGRRTTGGFICRCPVPGHGKGNGDRNPSFLVKDGERAPLFKCFAGCDPSQICDALRHRGLLDPRTRSRPALVRWETGDTPHVPDPDALVIWRAAITGAGSIVEDYLRGRGITLPIPLSIRSGSKLHLGKYDLPTMIAAVHRPDGKIVAVQSTLLTPEGKKALVPVPRATTGVMGCGAVRLGAAGEVLGLAEGLETALSAIQLTGISTWACLGAGRMHRVAIPDTVRELTIFADNDEPGRAAAQRTAQENRHRRVVLHFPPDCMKDWNDLLIYMARAAA